MWDREKASRERMEEVRLETSESGNDVQFSQECVELQAVLWE
jgi:hypothetical protein